MSRVDEIADRIAAGLDDARAGPKPGSHGQIIEGRRKGIHVRVTVWWSNRTCGWSVESTGASPPVLVAISRRERGQRAAIESGAIVAVPTGDTAFDADWLVEGAPSSAVLEALDPGVRAVIAAAPDVEIVADEGRVTGGANQNGYSAEEVERTLDAVVALRERLAALGPGPGEAASVKREIALLREQRDAVWARASWPARIVMVLAGTLLAAAVLAGLRYGCFPS